MATGSGVHVNEGERLIAHDFQDVGVAFKIFRQMRQAIIGRDKMRPRGDDL
jgi:hypothetical protein